jgi:hypothetical protein
VLLLECRSAGKAHVLVRLPFYKSSSCLQSSSFPPYSPLSPLYMSTFIFSFSAEKSEEEKKTKSLAE